MPTVPAQRRTRHRETIRDRAELRRSHEADVVAATHLLTNHTAGYDLVALNYALRSVRALHRGSRVVRRSAYRNPREIHRARIDHLIAVMRDRVQVMAGEAEHAPDVDSKLVLAYLADAVNQIGYR